MSLANLAGAKSHSRAILLALSVACLPLTALAQSKTVTVVNPATSPVNTRITNAVVPVEVSNADPIPVTATPAPAWIGTPFVDSRVVFSTGSLNCGDAPIEAPTGSAITVKTVVAAYNFPPDSTGFMLFQFRLVGESSDRSIQVPASPSSPIQQVAGIYPGYTGSLDFGGLPVTRWRACLSGGSSTTELAAGTLSVIGFVVPIPD